MHEFIMEKQSSLIIAKHLKEVFGNLYIMAQENEPLKKQCQSLLPGFDFENHGGLDFIYACNYAMGDKITETFLLKVLGDEYEIPKTNDGLPDVKLAQKQLMEIWIAKSQTEQTTIDNLLEGLYTSNVLAGVLNRLLAIGATEEDILGDKGFFATYSEEASIQRHLKKFGFLKILFTSEPDVQVQHLNYYLRMWIGTLPNVRSLNFRVSLNDKLKSHEWLNLFNQYGDDFVLQVLRTGEYDPDKPLSSIRLAELETMKQEEAAAEQAMKETVEQNKEDFLQGDTETQDVDTKSEPEAEQTTGGYVSRDYASPPVA